MLQPVITFVFEVTVWTFVALLHVFGFRFWCITSFGAYGHSVFDTFVQLTEGRSARDLPKQPPAKKKVFEVTASVDTLHTRIDD